MKLLVGLMSFFLLIFSALIFVNIVKNIANKDEIIRQEKLALIIKNIKSLNELKEINKEKLSEKSKLILNSILNEKNSKQKEWEIKKN